MSVGSDGLLFEWLTVIDRARRSTVGLACSSLTGSHLAAGVWLAVGSAASVSSEPSVTARGPVIVF